MKTPTNTKPPTTKRKLTPTKLVLSIIGAIFVGYLLYIYFHSPFSPINRAAEVAAPLESALVKAGGVKKCSSGDAGRGSDNDKPNYAVTYELPLNREQAIATINQAASENGYSLSHASVTNRGPVSVADQYLDNWFYDTVGKPSPYTDLQAGKIDLFFVVNNDGPIELSEVSCKTDKPVTVNSDANTSAVNIQIRLPQFVRE